MVQVHSGAFVNLPTERSWGFAFAAAVLFAASAAGAPAPLAVHPLVVVGAEEADRAAFEEAFDAVLAKLDVPLADGDRVRSCLQKTEARSCLESDACLGELARSTGASRALLVTVSPYSPKLVLTARLVSARGVLLRLFPSKEYSKNTRETVVDSFQLAAQEFTSELDLSEVAVGPVSAAPDAALEKGTPIPVGRKVGYGAVGLAILLGGTAGGIAIASRGDSGRLLTQLNADASLPEDNPSAINLHKSLQRRSRTVSVLMLASGASLAAGVTLLVLFPETPAQPPPLALRFSLRGTGFACGGTF